MAESFPPMLVFALLGGLLATLGWLVARSIGRVAANAHRASHDRASSSARIAATLAAEGGSPDHPIVVETTAIIDDTARRSLCARCGRDVLLEQHRASSVGGARLREVDVVCRWCAYPRTIYFRLADEAERVLH